MIIRRNNNNTLYAGMLNLKSLFIDIININKKEDINILLLSFCFDIYPQIKPPLNVGIKIPIERKSNTPPILSSLLIVIAQMYIRTAPKQKLVATAAAIDRMFLVVLPIIQIISFLFSRYIN